MYIIRAVEEMEQNDTPEERKELFQKAWEMAEDLGAFCSKNKIGSFEISPTMGRFTFFSEKNLPNAKKELYDKETTEERVKILKKAAQDTRNLISFCNKHKIGGFEAEAKGTAIVYTPRPF